MATGPVAHDVLDALPWPNVRGKRCAVLRGPESPDLGAGQRHLLERAGFVIERVGRAFTVDDGDAPRSRLETLLARVVTGRDGSGRVHRAVLARPARA